LEVALVDQVEDEGDDEEHDQAEADEQVVLEEHQLPDRLLTLSQIFQVLSRDYQMWYGSELCYN